MQSRLDINGMRTVGVERTYTRCHKSPPHFKAKYRIYCAVRLDSREELSNARRRYGNALEETVVDQWHQEVLLPQLESDEFAFDLILDDVFTCSPTSLDEKTIRTPLCNYQIVSRLRERTLVRYGCRVELLEINMVLDEDCIMSNYNLVDDSTGTLKEDSPEYRAIQRMLSVMLAKRRLDFERECLNVYSNEEHQSQKLQVKVNLAGQSVEIEYNLKELTGDDCPRILHGFRRTEGFCLDNSLNRQGTSVVQSQASGKLLQRLQPGTEYFFTFLLTEDEPVYQEATGISSLFQRATIKEHRTKVVDSLRFTVRIAAALELERVDRLIEAITQITPDSKETKINRALEEISSFVEFDETLTKVENELIESLKAKGYPPEELQAKTERLRLVVESLRVERM
jgi:hypothetical protein